MHSSVKNRHVDRISILLQKYNIETIIHIKGQNNCFADYLSRHPIQHNEEIFDEDYDTTAVEPPNELSSHLITSNQFDITKIKEEQSKDSFIQNKIKEIIEDPTKHPYAFKDGVLYKLMTRNATNTTKTKLIYLPSSMINSLLQSYHNDPLGGHFGIRRTYFKIKNKFWVAIYETIN
ncbi:unnamed protein product [Rotaria socialis]|uniref:Integrase zinc-binding domain-containing protein n=1 Tax=Rotaria socialis TaxID=392032 RepID=A0A821KTP6_9BILA|nr:unnamed protein product [Rotaria socialis]